MIRAIRIMGRTKKKEPIPRNDPRHEGMVSTGENNELCKSCRYGMSISAGNHNYACGYYLKTKKRRTCPIGWCNTYEKGKSQPDKWVLDLKNDEAWSNSKTYEV